MSELIFKKFNGEVEDLVKLLTTNVWAFHANPNQTVEQIVKNFKNGWYEEDKETFCIEYENQKVGLIHILDIHDSILLFDLRLDSSVRGRGFGVKAVQWITDYIFSLPDQKIRIEAYTRSDNIPMRKTLNKSGFVKEGYLRRSWENEDGSVSDALCYAMIRNDWEDNIKTPIKFDDFPF